MSTEAHHSHESTIVETAQSLVVAFVLAMTFRGFVTEGFVIPTGSMAPTLMGQHALMHSGNTGAEFAVGLDPKEMQDLKRVADAALGPQYSLSGTIQGSNENPRMGDRILVLKSFLPFSDPKRFDVVVFKNPTDPDGSSANYIKRLIGLPNEMIWLADGDVFVAPYDPQTEEPIFGVQRKPEHVQRAVWQRVHHSDFVPADPLQLDQFFRGGPWQSDQWDTTSRVYKCPTTEPSRLHWQPKIRSIDDWTPYNETMQLIRRGHIKPFNVSDVRVAATISAEEPAALKTTCELVARSHRYEWVIDGARGTVECRMEPADGAAGSSATSGPISIDLPAGPMNVEFWHADQRMAIFIDGDEIATLEYEWTARERMMNVVGTVAWDRPEHVSPPESDLALNFEGSPLTLERVALDRDLYYRPVQVKGSNNPTAPGSGFESFEDLVMPGTPGFGTSYEKPATLGPDHFFMCGDNSQASLDSRMWGNPHPLVAHQVDPSPFVVNRDLLIGKAWVVYFPSPFSMRSDGKWPVVPDFGRLRFIR